MEFVVVAIVVSAILGLWVAVSSNGRRTAAWEAYRDALSEYRRSPSDPYVRENAMMAGRRYSRLTQNTYGVRSFDEAALKNDLDAIAIQVSPATLPSASPSLEERLARLTDLHERGVISASEHANRRAEILREI